MVGWVVLIAVFALHATADLWVPHVESWEASGATVSVSVSWELVRAVAALLLARHVLRLVTARGYRL